VERPSGLQRAASALRAALPYVQRILPLLDGNIGTAVSNVLSPYPQISPAPPPVDLEPIEDGLAELQMQHRALRNQFLEQNASLKRIEDQLESVRETSDRNAREQEELLDGLEALRKKVNRVVVVASALLGVSVLLNVLLVLHIQHILP
jgi:glucosamine 6-phosphate synthetase-like amidotransferase/phosphosugar isomerase protein